MNTKGMTLIELLVYMAIAALLLTPVIMLMQNSSLNMARDAVNTDLRISGRDILNIMFDDLRNTGFKLESFSGAVNDSATFIATKVSAPSGGLVGDSSSFRPGDGGTNYPFDTLTIRKGRLDKTSGGWVGYDTVKYHVSGDTLIRESTEFNNANPPVPLAPPFKRSAIATNVEALQFQYSITLANDAGGVSYWKDGNSSEYPVNSVGFERKKKVKYIKIAVVTVDKKKLAPVKTFPETNIPENSGTYSHGPFDDQYLREISEIVVPIPNNGLFP